MSVPLIFENVAPLKNLNMFAMALLVETVNKSVRAQNCAVPRTLHGHNNNERWIPNFCHLIVIAVIKNGHPVAQLECMLEQTGKTTN